MVWFEEWFDENYLELYANRDSSEAHQQIDLILKELGSIQKKLLNGRWLDVGCGSGRYTKILHDQKISVTGIDLSKTMIDVGKNKHPELDLRHIAVEDILTDQERYDVALSLFTGFGYYDNDADNYAFLEKISQLIRLNGYFWLDFLNAEQVLNETLGDSTFQGISGKTFSQKRYVDDEKKRIVKTIEVFSPTGEFLKKYLESVRLFQLHDFEQMLPKAGFSIKKVFGDYGGNAYNANSPRLIICSYKQS